MEFRNSQAGSSARRYPEPTRQTTTNSNETTTQGGGAEAPVRNTMQTQQHSGKFRGPVMWVVALAVLLLVVLGGWFVWSKMGGDSGVKGGQYQAVFLTNGQVYFGKVSGVNDGYVKLADIYYLQVQQSVQPEDKNKNDQSQVSLAKLGSELHGPEDTMYISREQVLFWENLKNDGKVVEAINKYKEQK